MTFPIAKYADFALSRDTSSFSPTHPKNRDTQPPSLHGSDIKAGWAEVGAASAQTLLKMPLGWFGAESGSATTFYTPDEKTRLILRFSDILGELPAAQTAAIKDPFAYLKQRQLALSKAQLAKMGRGKAQVRQFSLSDGPIAIEARGLTSESGRAVAFLQVISPNPREARFPLSLSLTSPAADYEKNRELVGLILRDRPA